MPAGSDVDVDRWIVIPGFMKSGSTSVFSWLDDAHPAPASRPKEPRYFLQDLAGQEQLARYWCQTSGGSRTAIDGSVGYFDPAVSRDVARRIEAAALHGPAPHFIVTVRDPVERAVSHIRHDIRRGRLDRLDPEGAAALVRPGLPYFERSRLATSIRPFVETFPVEHILILDARAPDADKQASIAAFIGVPELMMAQGTDRRNETSVERSYTPLFAWIVDHGLGAKAQRLIPRRVRPLAAKALLRSPVDTIDAEMVRMLMSPSSLSRLDAEEAQFDALTKSCVRPTGWDGHTVGPDGGRPE